MRYDFSPEKNQILIKTRGISFEEIIKAIEAGKVLAILPNTSANHSHQEMYVININDYAYVVPFVKQGKSSIFLKTIFPHRKLTRFFLGDKNEKN